jgi:AcrR family transcriptional regulator
MTREDIIKAAYKVWGRDFYKKTSLSQLAGELKVSKPALYRHFKDKNALLEAMSASYYDDCAAFIKGNLGPAVGGGLAEKADEKPDNLFLIRIMAEYYIRNRDEFVFSLAQVFNNRDKASTIREFGKRGIDFRRMVNEEGNSRVYPSKTQLCLVTVFHCIGNFHRHAKKNAGPPSEEQIKRVLNQIDERIGRGMGLDARKVAALNYGELEQQAAGQVNEGANTLLRAAAEAVAEAGPWNVSMAMIAKHSGLSKSGLYAHFKNKKDMLGQLFITEFSQMVNLAKLQIETAGTPEVQLYLAIISIVNYLRSRPEILFALDWIKSMRIDLDKVASDRLHEIIGGIKTDYIRNYDRHLLVWAAQWILLMIVNTLAMWPLNQEGKKPCAGQDRMKIWAKNTAEVPNECFRVLFRFIALGLEGLNL